MNKFRDGSLQDLFRNGTRQTWLDLDFVSRANQGPRLCVVCASDPSQVPEVARDTESTEQRWWPVVVGAQTADSHTFFLSGQHKLIIASPGSLLVPYVSCLLYFIRCSGGKHRIPAHGGVHIMCTQPVIVEATIIHVLFNHMLQIDWLVLINS